MDAITPPHASPSTSRLGARVAIALLCIVAASLGVSATAAWSWSDRIYAGVSIGTLYAGGQTVPALRTTLSSQIQERLNQDLTVDVKGVRATISLEDIGAKDPDLSRPLVNADIEAALEAAYSAGRNIPRWTRPFGPLLVFLSRPTVEIPALVDGEEIARRILEKFPAYQGEPSRTRYLVTKDANAYHAAIVEGKAREQLDLDQATKMLREEFSTLAFSQTPISIAIILKGPRITLEQAVASVPKMEELLNRGPLTITVEGTGQWSITPESITSIVFPEPEGLVVDQAALDAFLSPIAASVLLPTQNARFEFSARRVQTFVPSRTGRSLALEESASSLRALLLDPASPKELALPIIEVEPDIPLSKANDLGVNEILGVGTSSYKGSPANRIKNIRNGITLLNGILIAPEETFSLLAALRPFSTDNGYLPELVIKGNEIKPEIGGGLCQIGTTTFRTTMNSGLPVKQRQNHSLVVTYYNDPANGNPGTDATIYEPAPDFSFLNDTGHYILFTTFMDETKKELAFTFWGTRDGRKGSYTPPVVEKWLPTGEPKITETTSLPPGKEECQLAHPGAVASFTYTIERPNGAKEDTVYTSHYRALPKICLRGVETITVPASEIPSTEPPVSLAE